MTFRTSLIGLGVSFFDQRSKIILAVLTALIEARSLGATRQEKANAKTPTQGTKQINTLKSNELSTAAQAVFEVAVPSASSISARGETVDSNLGACPCGLAISACLWPPFRLN